MQFLINTSQKVRRAKMGKLAIEIGVILVVFILGYWMGFRACFDYLDEEIQKKMEEDE